MSEIKGKVLDIDRAICKNIDRIDINDRGFYSQNILSQLRNFVEHVSLMVYTNSQEIENSYENIIEANKFVKSKGGLKFLSEFHDLLQISASHYTLDEENSERLMLKYYEYLLKIKKTLREQYNLYVLGNIDEFPINTDSNLKEYYEKISTRINELSLDETRTIYNDRYYIQRIKPFFVDQDVYYEVTLTVASDKVSKFDRVIAFTNLDLSQNYAVNLWIKNDTVNVFDNEMPIQIIEEWEVSIRPCELNNFAKILGHEIRIQSGNIEYRELMNYLTETRMNLVEMIDYPESDYSSIKNQIVQKAKSTPFFEVLDKCHDLVKNCSPGSNVIRYLLYRLNNVIIKKQYQFGGCEKLSNLNLPYGCIPFDEMPLNSSLINHNPKFIDLLDCINVKNREHELLARFIKNNTEVKGQLYTPENEIKGFENIDDLMKTYNSTLYHKHQNRRLEKYKDFIYIKGYEENTRKVIQKLKELSLEGIDNYSNSVQFWLQNSSYEIDSEEKETALLGMFENSKVALIYGSAGTGKSTMINHISNFFNDKKKLYLANTNPAVENLKRRVNAANCDFKTIAKFKSKQNCDTEYDILVIDECSTVSNSDMLEVITKASFQLLVLVGDVYQIDSIVFGNWFNISNTFVPETSVYKLTNPYRSSNPKLLDFWDKVRNMNEDILEHITKNDYSMSLSDSFFERSDEDEIILCLNYDGLYGINNLNRILQSNNESEAFNWGIQTYKVNDPVLFNESERFAPLIYNNLKGKIVGIELFVNMIQFDIELDIAINQLDAAQHDFQLLNNDDTDKSVIRFSVNKYRSTDEDDDLSSESVVPFQVAYAVSIHKAQGLEFNSVKVVITDEMEEMISHNIFYTAITRAKENLKIYWDPEVERKVLKNMELKNSGRDVHLLSNRFSLDD